MRLNLRIPARLFALVFVLATCSDPVGPSRPAAIESIELDPPSATAASIGELIDFTARAITTHGDPLESAALTWTSSDTTVLVHEGNGRFRARANGVAVVNVRPAGNHAHTWPSATVVVQQIATRIEIPGARTAGSGDTIELFATGQTTVIGARAYDALGVELSGSAGPDWSSANQSVATVDQQGTVTAKGDGETIVTITAGVVTRSFTVRVSSTFEITGCVTSDETSAAPACTTTVLAIRASR